MFRQIAILCVLVMGCLLGQGCGSSRSSGADGSAGPPDATGTADVAAGPADALVPIEASAPIPDATAGDALVSPDLLDAGVQSDVNEAPSDGGVDLRDTGAPADGVPGDAASPALDTAPAAPARFASVGLGYGRTCLVNLDGSARCWGLSVPQSTVPPGKYRQLLPVDEDKTLAVDTNGKVSYLGGSDQKPPPDALASIASSSDMSCGLRFDGTLVCWGPPFRSPVPPTGAFVELSIDEGAGCARRADGTVACWPTTAGVAKTLPAGPFKQIATASRMGCAINPDDTLICWGNPTDVDVAPPLGRYRKVQVTGITACALAVDGVIICWSGSSFLGSEGAPHLPVEGKFTELYYRGGQGCGTRDDGAWICWGSNKYGEGTLPEEDRLSALGGGCALDRDGAIQCFRFRMEAKETWPSGRFVAVDGKEDHGCALAADGSAQCWDTGPFASKDFAAPQGHTYKMVKASFIEQACGLRADTAEIECWGERASAPPPGKFTSFAFGTSAACGVRQDGNLECWGGSSNSGVIAASPPVGMFKQVQLRGDDQACALSAAGEIQCWGQGYALPTVPAGPFTQIASAQSWAALRPDGTIAIFYNAEGVKPPAGTFVELDPAYSCARTADGAKRCWDGILR
jgi:hypothetical protein